MKKIIILLTALLFISCGTRKSTTNKTVEKSESKVEVKAESETVTTTNTETNTITIDTSTTNEIVIEPINPLVEFIVNGKTYKNARITTKKVKSGVSVVNNVKVAKNEANTSKTHYKGTNKQIKAVKGKKVERDNTKLIVIIVVLWSLFWIWYFGIWRRKKGSVPTMDNPPLPPNNNLNK